MKVPYFFVVGKNTGCGDSRCFFAWRHDAELGIRITYVRVSQKSYQARGKSTNHFPA